MPSNYIQVSYVEKLSKNNSYDFWTPPLGVNHGVDIMVSSNIRESFLRLIQRAIDEGLKHQTASEFFSTYQPLSEIYEYMSIEAKRYPEIISINVISKTEENRELKVIRLGVNHKQRTKPVIWIDGGIHAREWISPATVIYIINKLIHDYKKRPKESLLQFFDWYLMPLVNPDGYEYSFTKDRLWRKNRSKIPWSLCRGVCRGVDLNKNFHIYWGWNGDSKDPCDTIYSGKMAFSERESRAVFDYIIKNKERIKAFITIHSYGQRIMYPWGWTKEEAPDTSDLKNWPKSVHDHWKINITDDTLLIHHLKYVRELTI